MPSKYPNQTRKNLLGTVGIEEAENELRDFNYEGHDVNFGVRGKEVNKNTYDNSKERKKRALLIEEMRIRLGLSQPAFCDKVGISTYKYNQSVIHQTTDFTMKEWDRIMDTLGMESVYSFNLKYYTKVIQGLPKKVKEQRIHTLRREYKENAEKRRK